MIKRGHFFSGLTGTAGLISLMIPVPLFAQSSSSPSEPQSSGAGLEEIVVTAQKQEQNISRVPMSITAVTSRAIETRGLQNVSELTGIVPSLQVGPSTGVLTPFLRGIGTTANALGNEPSVATYVDGIYFSRVPAGFFALSNLERVEALEGPQGTLFGRNASGGVISLVTKNPSHDSALKGEIGYGNYDTITGSMYGTSGLSDKVAIDLSMAGRYQRDGFGRNIITSHRASYSDYFTARSKLLFEPSDLTRLAIGGTYSYSKTGLRGNTYPGTTQGFLTAPRDLLLPLPDYYDQRSNLDGYMKATAKLVDLRVEQEFSFARLTSISAYMVQNESIPTNDTDYGPRPDFVVSFASTLKQFSQELQLASLPNERLQWLLGLYYYRNHSSYDYIEFRGVPAGVGLNAYATQLSKSYAAFAQATYEILPRLSVTAGARLSRDIVTANGRTDRNLTPPVTIVQPPPGKEKGNKLTFRTAIDYKPTPDTTLYASFSRGYKAGAFTLLTYNGVVTKPEILDAYEVGAKARILDGRVRLNAAGFIYDIKNPQVQLNNANTIILSNAESARVRGLQFQVEAALIDHLNLRAGAVYLDAKYKSYLRAPSGPLNPNPPFGAISPLLSIDASGNHLPEAPELTLTAGLDYKIDTAVGSWLISADYIYNDGFFWEPDNFLRQKSYSLLNGRIAYSPSDNLRLGIWGKNLLNEKYATGANTGAGPAGYPYTAAPPRTYGVTVGFDF